jgi:hypothetical protein
VHSLSLAATLEWDQTEANLEMTPEQEEIRATFTVTNNGDETVRISRIKTSCGCTGSVVDRKILEPGESTGITGTFNKGKRQGLNRNRLEVFIDGQAESVATLFMNVQIPTLIEVMPRIIYWNQRSAKTPRRIAVNLDGRYLDEILRIDYDQTKLEIIEKEDPQGQATVLLEIAPKSYEASYRGSITVYGQGPDGRTGEARIHAFVQP